MLCPKCKFDIDNDSCYCDQCGQEIRYCQSCRRPGKGNRCTACGGRMIPAIDYFRVSSAPTTIPITEKAPQPNYTSPDNNAATLKAPTGARLILSNGMLGITIEGFDGAIIGRRQGIYQNQFKQHPYVSGSHAKLKFDAKLNQWFLTDMNSSNGTRYNNTPLIAGKPCMLENGSTIQLANITLNVAIL